MAGVGYWAINQWDQSPRAFRHLISEQTTFLSGVIVEPVQHSPGRVTMLVSVQSIGEKNNKQPVTGILRLTWLDPQGAVYRGDEIQVKARIREPFGTRNPGGFDYGAFLQQRGVDAVALVRGPDGAQVKGSGSDATLLNAWNRVDRWRDQVRQAVLRSIGEPARGLFLGMIVGEQSYLDQAVRDDFMTTGTVHIISISGSHLGLLAFLSFFIVRGGARRIPAPWLERLSCRLTPKQLAVILTLPLVGFYTLLSGAHVATVRSLIMIALYLLAVWFGHERQMMIALGLSALFATLFDPMVIYDLSFQLSYVSVFAIALALQLTSPPEDDWEFVLSSSEKLKNWIKQYFLISGAASLATLPLVALYFNQVAWLGVLANMVVVPFVGFFVVPLGLFSSILTLALDMEHLPLAGLNQRLLDGLNVLVHIIAEIPGAEWHVASPAPLAIGAFYFCLFLVFRDHRPMLRWGSTFILVGLISWWLWSPRQFFSDDTLRITFLDVGQGDATLLELPEGQVLLIDGGAAYERWNMGRSVVGPYLWDQGIRKIDHLIATHPQLDHVGGLAWIIRHFEVGYYWTNGVQRPEPFYQNLIDAVEEQNLVSQVAWAGSNLLEGESPCQLRSLNPSREISKVRPMAKEHYSGADLNNLSVVLSLTCGDHSILFSADAEVDALERMAQDPQVQRATMIKIPHHGAKSSFSEEWVKQLTAKIAVVSAGQRNRYGHPAPSVLQHYEQQGMKVYRTDQDGAVLVSQNLYSKTTEIHTAQEQRLLMVNPKGDVLQQETENFVRLWKNWSGAY